MAPLNGGNYQIWIISAVGSNQPITSFWVGIYLVTIKNKATGRRLNQSSSNGALATTSSPNIGLS